MSLQTRSMERTSAGDKQQTWVQNRIFIEDMNSLMGSALVEEFINDNENDFNPNIIIGNGESLPRGASKLIDSSQPSILGDISLELLQSRICIQNDSNMDNLRPPSSLFQDLLKSQK